MDRSNSNTGNIGGQVRYVEHEDTERLFILFYCSIGDQLMRWTSEIYLSFRPSLTRTPNPR